MIADLFTHERHLVYSMPDCHHIYIFLFLIRFRKALEVVNFFLKRVVIMRFCSVTFFYFFIFFKKNLFIQVCFRFTLKLKGRNRGVLVWFLSPMTEFVTRIFVVQTGQYHPDSISSCCSFYIQYCAKYLLPSPDRPSPIHDLC